MIESKNSTQLLRDAIAKWEDLFSKTYQERTVLAWMDMFVNEDPELLSLALERATKFAKRRPAPGDLAEALVACRSEILIRNHGAFAEYETTDVIEGNTVKCWIGSDNVKRYRPEDTPEGRQFLSKLREPGKSKSMLPMASISPRAVSGVPEAKEPEKIAPGDSQAALRPTVEANPEPYEAVDSDLAENLF